MATAAVQVQYRLTRADVFRALARNAVRGFWFLLVVPVVGIASLAWVVLDPAGSPASVPGAVAMVAVGTVFFLAGPWLQTRAALKNPELAGTVLVTFSTRGIAVVTPRSSLMREWSSVARVCETRSALILHSKDAGFQIVPKAALSEADLAALRRLVAECAPARAR